MADKPIMEINVVMLGGQRCGKTSVLAAMHECFDDTFGRTDMTISTADSKTMAKLSEKREEFKSYYRGDEKYFETENKEGTQGFLDYSFYVTLKSKKSSCIKLNFTDMNGEFLHHNDKTDFKNGDVANCVKNADVIMITVDTPYLMEHLPDDSMESVGDYNNHRNKCDIISELIKNCFHTDETSRKKMILFVPLKCEKYYWDKNVEYPLQNGLAIVAKRLKTAYKSLINYLSHENNRTCYEVAITPIMTMGNVLFSGFKRETNPETGQREYSMNKKYDFPNIATYRFDDKIQTYEPAPKFCEQPFIYIILYMLRITKQQLSEKENSFWGKFIGNSIKKLRGFAFAEDFASQEPELLDKIKTGNPPHYECGFEILTDPIRLEEYDT